MKCLRFLLQKNHGFFALERTYMRICTHNAHKYMRTLDKYI